MKCELCPKTAVANDILCYLCGVKFEAHPPAAELYESWERNQSAAMWIADTYGPLLALRSRDEPAGS